MNRNVEEFLERMSVNPAIRDKFFSCKDWGEAYAYAQTLQQGFSLMDLIRGFCQSNQRIMGKGSTQLPCEKIARL